VTIQQSVVSSLTEGGRQSPERVCCLQTCQLRRLTSLAPATEPSFATDYGLLTTDCLRTLLRIFVVFLFEEGDNGAHFRLEEDAFFLFGDCKFHPNGDGADGAVGNRHQPGDIPLINPLWISVRTNAAALAFEDSGHLP